MSHTPIHRQPPFGGRGYSLIEMMVAITIAVFLLTGLFMILQSTRHSSTQTSGLSDLQDEERVAMTMLTDIIQTGGYYPNAVGGSVTSALSKDPDLARFKTDGQIFYGGANANPAADWITVRFAAAPGDTVINCIGQQNPTTGSNPQIYLNKFLIGADPITGVSQLQCAPTNGVTGTPLVNNVTGMRFFYAVNTTGATSLTPNTSTGPNTSEAAGFTNNGCPADMYIPTANMTDLDWTNVCAVKVQLTFVNPLYQPAGQPNPTPGQPQTLTFERVIAVLSKAGIDTMTITPPGGGTGGTSGP
jgi:type IV pilus assembly protein PilW